MKVKWDVLTVVFLIAVYTVVFSYYSILRHDAFASNYDLGNMDQTMWTTLHGDFFTMSTAAGNISRLATHADFILILLSPIYLIWDNVRALLIVQSFLLALGAIPVFFISKKMLNSKIISLIFVLVYLLNPGLQKANLYDFHGVTIAIPALLFTFYFALTKRWKLYWLFFFISIVTKEQVSVILAIMGLLIIFSFKEFKIGLISFLIGLLWFPLMVFAFIPMYTPTNQHWAFDLWFAQHKKDIDTYNIFNLFSLVWDGVTSQLSKQYYPLLLWPFAFLPLLGFPWFLMSLPDLLINTTSSYSGMKTINAHYQSTIIPGFLIATVFAFKKIDILLKKFKVFNAKLAIVFLSLFLLLTSIIFSYSNGPLPISPDCWCAMFRVTDEDKEFEKIIQALPKDTVISASGEVRSHLAHRQNAFNIPTIPKNVEYVALIDQDRSYNKYTPHYLELGIINDLRKDKNFKEIYQKGHFYLFKKLKTL